MDLREIARALGGEVVGGQVLAPGPGHSPRDRSMTVRLSPNAPDGFLAFSHAGDDWRACRDYVRERLGLRREERETGGRPLGKQSQSATVKLNDLGVTKTKSALTTWREGGDLRGALGGMYLARRGLTLGDNLAHVLRWHGGAGALLALFRSIGTDEPQAVSRTFLNAEGQKIERRFLGPVGGAAIKLDPDDVVTGGLHIGEGVETCLAARQLGLRPAWALGSAGAIAAFPVLAGIECLTLLAENDEASRRATEACAARWHTAGREVLINRSTIGSDLNDAIRGRA